MDRETALITGSSKGLGKQLAMVFAENGYNLIIHGRNEDDLRTTQRELWKITECDAVEGDLRNNETIGWLYNMAKNKNLAVLVNNAGIDFPNMPFEEEYAERLAEVLNVNLIAPIKLTHALYPLILANKGRIINVNSLLGVEPREMKTAYCASKWGLRGFTDSLRLEAEKAGIKIMGVYPTRMKTKGFTEYGLEPREVAQKIYSAYQNDENNVLIDGRSPEFRTEVKLNA